MSRGHSKSRGALFATMAMSTPAGPRKSNRTPSAMASAMASCTSVTPEMRPGLPKSKSGQKPISDNVRRLLAGDSAFDDDFEDEGRKITKRLKTDNQTGGIFGRMSQKKPGTARQQSTLTSIFQRQPGFLKHLGIANLGNTCYMNAVTQAILGLPVFASDLTKPEVAALSLPENGVITALRKCIEARKQTMNKGQGTPLSLEDLKRAMEHFAGFGHGAMQQDAHEFTCLLLQTLQNEILAAEWKRAKEGRPIDVDGDAEGDEEEPPSVKLSDTCCPVARNFEFSLVHSFVCDGCGHRSQMLERFNHLSLELPSHAEPPKTSDLAALLGAYMEGGSVEKGCEGCGASSASHRLSSAFARAPEVLVLHLKRFQVVLGQDGAMPQLRKLKVRVRAPGSLALGPWCLRGTLPPAHRCPEQRPRSPRGPKGPWWEEDCNKENRPTSSSTPTQRASAAPFARTASKPRQQQQQQQQRRKSLDIKALLQQGSSKGGAAAPGFAVPGGAMSQKPLLPLEARDLEEEQLRRTLEASHNEGASSEEALLQQALLASLQDSGGKLQKKAEAVPSASPSVEVIHLDSDDEEDEDVRKALALSLKDAEEANQPMGPLDPETSCAGPKANTCWVQVTDKEVANSFTRTDSDERQGGGVTCPEAVPKPVYSLRSVIRHIGQQATEGHFVAEVRGKSGWVQYDDSHVSALSDPTAIAASADRERECYLLFYDLTK